LAAFIAFLSLTFVGAIGISVKLRLAPLFTETFVWLETSMPVITFANGVVTSAAPGPLRLEHPRKEIAVMIDTARKDAVTAQQLDDAKVVAYLTSDSLYVERGRGADGKMEIETIPFKGSASDQPITVDSGTYKEMERAFDWVFYPALMLFFFLTFATSIAACGLLYALFGLILASVAGGSLGYGALFRVAVHAQAAGSLLYALDAVLPFAIPKLMWISIASTLGYLWFGVKAAAVPGPAPEAAPPSAPAA
jgi:hypothetical protein